MVFPLAKLRISCFQNTFKHTHYCRRLNYNIYSFRYIDKPLENINDYQIYNSFISDENGADSNPCDDPELQVEKPNVSINDEVPSDEKENLQPEPDISTIAIKQLSGDENVINTAVED